MKQTLRFNKVIKFIIITGDLCLLNSIFISFYHNFDYQNLGSKSNDLLLQLLVLLNLIYILFNYHSGVILHRRFVRPENIMVRAFRNTSIHAIVFIALVSLAHFCQLTISFYLAFYLTFLITLIVYRLSFRSVIKFYRRSGGNSRTVIFVGCGDNIAELYHQMADDATSGFRIIGYFSNAPSTTFPKELCHLGKPEEALNYLCCHNIEQVYCGLPSAYSDIIIPIINYCENHLIHFLSVPNIRNYLKRRMYFEMIGNVPVLSIRREPLKQPENQLIKRLFDIVFSLLFLSTLFPIIFIIIGVAIKISSPGPILFRQKRSGEDGKEFWCYKFRSMRVNIECDTLQATQNDPRKTRLGNFLRKSSIDELPQFINVLLGNMSVVGPRPHMLKHTEQYAALIDKYMVRHFIKPGVTGWAQVTGYRGETNELWQMEGRVQRDIWYLEHWTFALDLYIIYRTVMNAVRGEKEAY